MAPSWVKGSVAGVAGSRPVADGKTGWFVEFAGPLFAAAASCARCTGLDL